MNTVAKKYAIIDVPDEKEMLQVKKRLGKMRIQDIADDLDIKISLARAYRTEILKKIDKKEKKIILENENVIEDLRNKILTGKTGKMRKNRSFGIEGLVRGIIRDLLKQKKIPSEIQRQTGLELSTIYYHKNNIENGIKRKYPPRLMNMHPNNEERVKRLLEKGKRQTEICKILDISSAAASIIARRVENRDRI